MLNNRPKPSILCLNSHDFGFTVVFFLFCCFSIVALLLILLCFLFSFCVFGFAIVILILLSQFQYCCSVFSFLVVFLDLASYNHCVCCCLGMYVVLFFFPAMLFGVVVLIFLQYFWFCSCILDFVVIILVTFGYLTLGKEGDIYKVDIQYNYRT